LDLAFVHTQDPTGPRKNGYDPFDFTSGNPASSGFNVLIILLNIFPDERTLMSSPNIVFRRDGCTKGM
jgi:hypothetical protein